MANRFELDWSNYPAFEAFGSELVESAVGEDISWLFTPDTDTGTIDVHLWTIQFDVAPSDNRNPVVTIPSADITKGLTGSISFSTLKVKTQIFQPREYYWELIRTDSGNRKVLRFGRWKLTGSPSLFPGVTIPATIIPTNKGGTGSDLSETGPAVIIQASAGANLTALAADLSDTALFLRKDLTWQTPSGAGIGTVTTVSVVTANGISGSVANPTSTPAITITLGAITPTSIVASGTISGSNLSGTNTGDQTNISGNAATVSVIDAGGDTTCWVLLGTTQTGNLSPATDASLTYNATTNALTATTFIGALAGNADTVTTNANLTGPIASTGNATSITSQTGTGTTFAMSASPTFTTNITTPKVIGGISTTQTLTYQTTSGVGASGADHIFLVGNNGSVEAMRILNSGKVGISSATPGFLLEIAESSVGGADQLFLAQNNGKGGVNGWKVGCSGSTGIFDFTRYISGSGTTCMTLLSDGSIAVIFSLAINQAGVAPGGRVLSVTGNANQYTADFQGSPTSGQSYGPWIKAGTNTADAALLIMNAAADATYFKIRGDGLAAFGANTFGAQVQVTVGAAGTIGQIIKLAATPSAHALDINSSSGSGGDLAYISQTGGAYFAAASGIGTFPVSGRQLAIYDNSLAAICLFNSTTGSVSTTRGTQFWANGSDTYIINYETTGKIFLVAKAASNSGGITLIPSTTAWNLIGIGTDSPDSQLKVTSTGASLVAMIAKGATSRTAPLIQLQSDSGASLGNVGGTIFNNFTDTATTSTNGTEDDLYSYTTVANTLAINGDSIHQTEHVQFVSSATASRRIKKYFAGTLIFDSGALTLTLGGDFVIETMVIRESSSVVRCSVNVVTTSASSVPYATYTRITGLTLSGTNILKTTGTAAGTGAASGDIVNKLSKVRYEPAA